ncbi:RluA family pseudouridine synthase [Blochmannia endosymbiont of Polyrhachis (Hedomyrma) turneri]|uniref:RluA family pseudouridine synthase n=1 Tax=Blochmannia endosymbiont of Polyrhachis (Hedomyrma) turneri TaxID=1505596 RepID=UPI00061A7974|nr:RluA family pseudouridine synthase [Blochmannia endosymbiont of Polyrhachis (Hedomyrma) turneri]AKC59973.1 Ribosomal large subunit pseudouridine synthase C [Blochmannia endosymbiont of Polyrhachis (Hedomyrma) turneri]
MKTYNNNVNLITISSPNIIGRRIDNFLLSYLKGISRNKVYSILRKGEIRVNKKRVKCMYRLNFGDIIRIPPIRNVMFERNNVCISETIIRKLFNSVLYEDDHLIILNKPSGIAVHAGSKLSYGIIEGLRTVRPELDYLSLVHRLDKETSGVLLLAKNYFSLIQLHEQLRLNVIKKEYLALVFGKCKFNFKVVTVPLSRHSSSTCLNNVKVNSIVGKYSKTYFIVQERFIAETLLRVNPITGRTHQIRVHAQYIGNPIAYDKRYGDAIYNQKIKISSGLNRLFLHASKLRFIHPINGKTFCIEAPMDKILSNCLLFLRK